MSNVSDVVLHNEWVSVGDDRLPFNPDEALLAGATQEVRCKHEWEPRTEEIRPEEFDSYEVCIKCGIIQDRTIVAPSSSSTDTERVPIPERWKELYAYNGGMHTRTLIEELGRAEAAISQARPILEQFARENPAWQDFSGRVQDPLGVHALLAALAATQPEVKG